jgi:PAS domain S-box-containing protein
MPLLPNQDLLAIAFFEASASFILLVLCFLLQGGFPARFFRYWLAGWALFTGYGASRVLYALGGGRLAGLLSQELLFAAGVLFLAAVLEYLGRSPLVAGLWAMAGAGIVAVGYAEWKPASSPAWHWAAGLLQSALFLWAGWALWRNDRRQRGHGEVLLAAALLLCGLHGLDRADWSAQPIYLLRVSFGGLFEVTTGIAMVVLVLEAGRFRIEDLNDKLRRLTLITAATTQSFHVDEVLSEVLKNLVQSLGLSHGLVGLLEGEGDSAAVVIRAAEGFSQRFLEQSGRISASAPWASAVLQQGAVFLAADNLTDPQIRRWMTAEKLAAIVLVRLPGKEAPLGLMGVGSTVPRTFQEDEILFLVNVANLLGLTVQNVWLFQQVAQAERQWMYTFDSIGDPILVHDPECRVLRVNQALARRLGAESDSLAGRPVAELLRRGEARWSQCPYCEGAAGRAEELDPDFHGYFLATNSDFHDSAGVKLGTIHVLRDLTERKRVEENYRNLFANVHEGVFVSTPDGRFVDFNESFQRMLGYDSREELLQAGIAEQFYASPSDRERLKRLLREHGAVSNFEYPMRRRDGETRIVSESSVATFDASGEVAAYQGFVLDVTERKRAEQELRRRNHELMVLNSIAQTLSQPLELDQLLAQALRQTVELFGVDLGAIYLLDERTDTVRRVAAVGFRSEYAQPIPPTVASKAILEHIREVHPTHISPMSLPLPPAFRDLHAKEGVEAAHSVVLWSKQRILGGLVLASRTVREFGGPDLNLLAAVGNQIAATIDKANLLEESRLAYENLRRAQEQLLQSEKMAAVGQLISGVAHELNNPLTAILGYAQLLSSSQHVTPRGSDYVDKLHKQAQRTHRIVQNLLSFARPHRPERLPVRLNQVVDDTLILREYDLKVNNIQVHRELDPKLPPTSGDAHQLQQVFLNILNNAVDAILERANAGEIWVRTASAGSRLQVEFTDSGPGLTEPSRVFDPFYTTKPVGKGTGLGLSICYGIINEHGGEIEARNVPHRGACFRIFLPVIPVELLADAGGAPAAEARLYGSVLLVDDEDAVLDLEQEILKGRCRSVRAVRSGREALEALQREQVDVVVTDMKMPGDVSGADIYQWIEQHRPELSSRVVFTLSNSPTEGFGEQVLKNGCAYVQKPFQVEDFLRALRQVMDSASPSPVKPRD